MRIWGNSKSIHRIICSWKKKKLSLCPIVGQRGHEVVWCFHDIRCITKFTILDNCTDKTVSPEQFFEFSPLIYSDRLLTWFWQPDGKTACAYKCIFWHQSKYTWVSHKIGSHNFYHFYYTLCSFLSFSLSIFVTVVYKLFYWVIFLLDECWLGRPSLIETDCRWLDAFSSIKLALLLTGISNGKVHWVLSFYCVKKMYSCKMCADGE